MTGNIALVNIKIMQVNTNRKQILKTLRDFGGYVSGEMLSKQLGISRVSIWKHINTLKEEGYTIDASSSGYKLVSTPDLMLPYEFSGLEERIHYFPEIGSTMDKARELAIRGAKNATIVIAESQTNGRGRLNREWISPKGGIYFTIILRPGISPVYAPRINLMVSIAVASTIRKLFRIKAELKWPNDVLIDGRKVCGILAEMNAETDVVNFVNVGIGININASVSQFEKTSTSLKDELGMEISRREFLQILLREIKGWQPRLMKADLLKEWKKLSMTLNTNVRVVALDEEIVGRAIDIDSVGALIIKENDGSLKKAIAGDCIHLREAQNADIGGVYPQH